MGTSKKHTQYKKTSAKAKKQPPKRKTNWIPIALAAVLVVVVAVVLLLPGGGEAGSAANPDAQTIAAGGSLVIPVSEVSSTARFYPVVVDGVEMEIIAVKGSDGSIRTAFNTCQVCYSSGRGYYVQDGDYLVCQNCGNRFTVDQVEIESGGCNPVPIFPESKTVTGESVSISYDYLSGATRIFANWKQFS